MLVLAYILNYTVDFSGVPRNSLLYIPTKGKICDFPIFHIEV